MGGLTRSCGVDGAIVVQPSRAQRAPSARAHHPCVRQGWARRQEMPLTTPGRDIGGASSPPLVFRSPHVRQLLGFILSLFLFLFWSGLSFGRTCLLALLSIFCSFLSSAFGLVAWASFVVSGWCGRGAIGRGAGWSGGSFPWTNLVTVGILWVLHWLLDYRAQKFFHQSWRLLSWLGWRLWWLQHWCRAATGFG